MKSKPSTILCIDDDADILDVCQMTLESVGDYTAHTAIGGLAGIELAQTVLPDVILLDYMMPGLDGPATLMRLKGDPMTAHIPVIFVTARVQPSEVAHYKALGVAGVIAKPFNPQTICQDIEALWLNSRA